MILPIIGVVRDLSPPPPNIAPTHPVRQRIDLPRGEDLVIKLTVVRESGAAIDISGGTIKLGVRKFRHDTDDVFAVAATGATVGGLADIVIASAMTLNLVENFDYVYDVQWTDGAGKRWQLVPASPLRIVPIVNRPGE
jgi:hypothetical protein